jgi:P2X purinoceptor 4
MLDLSWTSSYKSVKLIRVHNKSLARLYYLFTLIILLYVALVSIWWNKGYQFFEPIHAASMLKVKGTARVADGTVYDMYEMVVPPQQPGQVFIGTNFLLTKNQTKSVCGSTGPCNCTAGWALSPANLSAVWEYCCAAGSFVEAGMLTGKCVAAKCEVKGWCPVEGKATSANNLIGVESWTLFARVNVLFPKWGLSTSNTKLGYDISRGVNGVTLFDLQGMLADAGTTLDAVQSKGAVLLAEVDYSCNLDLGLSRCAPSITFLRLDDPNDPISSGFNFRYQVLRPPHTTALSPIHPLTHPPPHPRSAPASLSPLASCYGWLVCGCVCGCG